MNKTGILLMFFLLNTLFTYGQQIEVRKVFGGYKYRQYDKPISTRKMVKVMRDEPEALRLAKSARTLDWVSTPFLIGGGMALGDMFYSLGQGDGWKSETLGLGAGLLAIGFWVGSLRDRKKRKAVTLFNAELSSLRKPMEIKLVNKHATLGFMITF